MVPPTRAPFAHHLVLRLRADRVIAPGLHERRLLARAVLEMGRDRELLAFGLADNHLHVQVISSRGPALRLARRVGISVTKRLCLPTGFAPTHAEPIYTMVHCRRAFRYVLCQGARHGLETDPDWEGTNLPDLLGLRPVGAHTAAVARRWLPRLTRQDLLGWAGVGAWPVPGERTVDALWEAALAAAPGVDLRRSGCEARRVRCALVHLAGTRRTTSALARLLDSGVRTVTRLRAERPHPVWVAALQGQVAWRARPERGAAGSGVFEDTASATPAATPHR